MKSNQMKSKHLNNVKETKPHFNRLLKKRKQEKHAIDNGSLSVIISHHSQSFAFTVLQHFFLHLRVRQQMGEVNQICVLSSRPWQGVLAFSVLYIFLFSFCFVFGELTELMWKVPHFFWHGICSKWLTGWWQFKSEHTKDCFGIKLNFPVP